MDWDYFDCKGVIYNKRRLKIMEGREGVSILNADPDLTNSAFVFNSPDNKTIHGFDAGGICQQIHYHEQEEKVMAFFEDGSILIIRDYDEIIGMDAGGMK
jgi:hypothetical protein